MVTTLDNQAITLSGQTNKVISQSILKLSVNCYGLVKASRLGLVFVGVGNANQSAADPKSVLYFYYPQK